MRFGKNTPQKFFLLNPFLNLLGNLVPVQNHERTNFSLLVPVLSSNEIYEKDSIEIFLVTYRNSSLNVTWGVITRPWASLTTIPPTGDSPYNE